MRTISLDSIDNEWLRRWWHSPVLMSWLNTTARIFSLVVILPLVLHEFSPAEISVFYLFSSVVSMQLVVSGTFVHTFSRIINYVWAGADLSHLARHYEEWRPRSGLVVIDKHLMSELLATMQRLFLVLALFSIPLAVVLGGFGLRKPISEVADPGRAWLAWGIVVLVSPLVIYSLQFNAFLQGVDKLALEQRWAALFAIGGSLSGAVVLLLNGDLLALIVVNQLWQVAGFIRLRWLAGSIARSLGVPLGSGGSNREIMRVIWPTAWRSAVGIMSAASIPVVGSLWFAQVLPTKALAELLLGMRVMNIISEFCRPPFYSRIPSLNMMRAQGDLASLVSTAKRGMRVSYLTFVILFLLAPIVASLGLPWIGSQIDVPETDFWLILGAASLLERLGSMHIQIYSTTNEIIMHWLNGWSSLIAIALSIVLSPRLGGYAFAVGLLISMVVFFSWQATRYSLNSLRQGVWAFEKDVFLPAALLQLVGSVVLGYWSRC